MQKVTVDEVAARAYGSSADGRRLSDPLETTDLALSHYRLEPGERISGLHGHVDQEEVFVVVEGQATFEVLADEVTGEVSAETGDAIRFAPGEYQSGKNAADEQCVVYALGAPGDSEDVRIPLSCPACGHEDRRPTLAADRETPVLRCPDCGAEAAVECPDCGSADLEAVLGADGETPVSVCNDCGGEFSE